MPSRSRTASSRRPAPPRSARPGNGQNGSRARSIFVVLAVAVAIGVLVAVALALGGRDDSGPAATSAPEGDGSHPVELAHIHGLGVDAADGRVYAGTHHGLVRVPEAGGEPVRIADRVQDFMGFTVVGPRHYLASGHPGEGQAGPHNLGLIESTDGGQTWQTLSLEGEADFHALEAKHGLIYGYSGGNLMVSRDGKTWETRAEQLAIADLAVSATTGDTVLATSEQGLLRSTNGGRTFSVVSGAPLLQLVTWPEGQRVVGLAPDGSAYASTDGGTTWTKRGSVGGLPHALTATTDRIIVALDGAVVSSADDGATFSVLYRR